MPLIRTYNHDSIKLPLRELPMYAHIIAFSLCMVVLNRFVSHALILHRSFMGLLMALEQKLSRWGK